MMKQALLLAALAAGTFGIQAAVGCDRGEQSVTRVTYEVHMPVRATAGVDWDQVQSEFPDARGVSRRIVYVTPDRYVRFQEGFGVYPNRDGRGVPLRFRGTVAPNLYAEQRRFTSLLIQTDEERITYNSIAGRATRRVGRMDRNALEEFGSVSVHAATDAAGPVLGTRQYAGAECVARKVPFAGPQSESCVTKMHGWPVALYVQWMDDGQTKQLQWARAIRIDHGVCVASRELDVPEGVQVRTAGTGRRS